MTTGEHDWLNEPERTHWRVVSLSVLGRDVQLEIPEKSSGVGRPTELYSFVANEDLDSTFRFSSEWEHDRFSRIITLYWDRAWGGFYEQSEWDFSLDISVLRIESDENRLELSADDRMQLEILEKQARYVGFTGWPTGRVVFRPLVD